MQSYISWQYISSHTNYYMLLRVLAIVYTIIISEQIAGRWYNTRNKSLNTH